MFWPAGVLSRCVLGLLLIDGPRQASASDSVSGRLPLRGDGYCRMVTVGLRKSPVGRVFYPLLVGVVVSPPMKLLLPPFDRGGDDVGASAGWQVLLVDGWLLSSPSQRKRLRTAVEEMEMIFEIPMAVPEPKELVSETIDFAD